MILLVDAGTLHRHMGHAVAVEPAREASSSREYTPHGVTSHRRVHRRSQEREGHQDERQKKS